MKLTRKEAAKYAGCHPSHLDRARRAGDLKFTVAKNGYFIEIDPKDVDVWLRVCREKTWKRSGEYLRRQRAERRRALRESAKAVCPEVYVVNVSAAEMREIVKDAAASDGAADSLLAALSKHVLVKLPTGKTT